MDLNYYIELFDTRNTSTQWPHELNSKLVARDLARISSKNPQYHHVVARGPRGWFEVWENGVKTEWSR